MGQTMVEGTILKWLKNEGDAVQGWEEVVEMMTDKINMGVEANISGTILKILAPEGAIVPVGSPIAVIGSADEDITHLLSELAGGPGAGAEAIALSEPAETGPAIGNFSDGLTLPPLGNGHPAEHASSGKNEFPSVSPRAREIAEAAGISWKSLEVAGTGFEGMIVERDVVAWLERQRDIQPLSTPLAAKMAGDLGVDLEDMVGSGPRGKVVADDVRRVATRRSGPVIEERILPLQGMRKVIAGRLSASYQQAVHVPLRTSLDMSAAAELRRQLKPALEATGAKLTYTDLIAAAVVRALIAQPLLNATLENDTVHVHPGVQLGIAVALDEGLTVPVVRDAHALTLPELSLAIQETANRARKGQLPAEAYANGTFTITNLGQFGVDSFDPIINPPQVAILGVGSIRDQIVPVNGLPAVRPIMTLTVTFDHRATDGAPAARFLAEVKALLENPARLLL